MRLSVSLAVLATMVAAGIAPALAESWPTQTVKIITPFPPVTPAKFISGRIDGSGFHLPANIGRS